MLREFLRSTLLVVGGALGLMMVIQMGEITRFVSLSGDLVTSLLFFLYQIPYVLPNALPIACLVGSYMLLRRMSVDGELSALRAGGMSLSLILSPLLFLGVLLGMTNLWIASEMAPYCRASAKSLFDQVAQENPLALFQQKRLLKIPNVWVQGENEGPSSVLQPWFLMEKAGQWMLLHGERASIENQVLKVESPFLLALRPSHQEMVWERAQSLEIPARALSPYFIRQQLSRNEDYGSWIEQWKGALSGESLCIHEILRRIALGIAPWATTLLGASYGATVARFPKRGDAMVAGLLTLLILGGFLAGKFQSRNLLLATISMGFPLVLSMSLSLFRLRRLGLGQTS